METQLALNGTDTKKKVKKKKKILHELFIELVKLQKESIKACPLYYYQGVFKYRIE